MSVFRFTVGTSGINSAGNHYCKLHYSGPKVVDTNTYHYYNRDGSYFYKNPDGSSYYNNGRGFEGRGYEAYTFPPDENHPMGNRVPFEFGAGEPLYPPPPCEQPDGTKACGYYDPVVEEGEWYPMFLRDPEREREEEGRVQEERDQEFRKGKYGQPRDKGFEEEHDKSYGGKTGNEVDEEGYLKIEEVRIKEEVIRIKAESLD